MYREEEQGFSRREKRRKQNYIYFLRVVYNSNASSNVLCRSNSVSSVGSQQSYLSQPSAVSNLDNFTEFSMSSSSGGDSDSSERWNEDGKAV
ncbi:MAG: hypothetical protein EOO89_16265 [Pedobacter sp.]|nr:MAG: hypothetical protein EOO89_16265 [Pedobacter sp.]